MERRVHRVRPAGGKALVVDADEDAFAEQAALLQLARDRAITDKCRSRQTRGDGGSVGAGHLDAAGVDAVFSGCGGRGARRDDDNVGGAGIGGRIGGLCHGG